MKMYAMISSIVRTSASRRRVSNAVIAETVDWYAVDLAADVIKRVPDRDNMPPNDFLLS
jgi:hypothetical protein